jgi:ABC-type antimicrobial peptide transport system permease subunit
MITQTHGGETYDETTISMPLGNTIASKYKDLFKNVALISFPNGHVLGIGDKKISGYGIYAQEFFPSMFGLTILNGNMQSLKDPSTIMISKSIAVSLFGNANAANKMLLLDNMLNMKVGAVYEDLPENSSFATTTLLLPWTNTMNNYLTSNTNWHDHNGEGFVEFNDNIEESHATEKIKNIPTPFTKDFREEALVYRLDKLHLYGEFKNGKPAAGRIQIVVLMGFIGAFVLLLACINFINLSTAGSSKRAREVGIRKTMGSLAENQGNWGS